MKPSASATAKEGISALQPDLVVWTLGLEDGDGFELMIWLHRDHPHVTMLVFSGHEIWFFHRARLPLWRAGYVVKARRYARTHPRLRL